MKKITIFSLIFLCTTYISQANADDHLALLLKVSNLGGGADAVLKINDVLNGRIGANYIKLDYDNEAGGIDYDFDAELLTPEALLDWFPFHNGFRFTGGAIYNLSKLEAEASPQGGITIGSTTYTSGQVGTLRSDVDFDKVAPYLGVGWGQPFGKESRWAFNFDLGVMYLGEPDVDLSADGTLASNPAFQADLEREREQLKDALEKWDTDKLRLARFYPVLALGVTYRF